MIRPDILTAITEEIARARAKHGAVSMSSPFIPDAERVRILTAEVAEVEQAADNLDVDGAHGIRAELTQVAACAIAWLSTLPVVEVPEPCECRVCRSKRDSQDLTDGAPWWSVFRVGMTVCDECGNKRCPKARYHCLPCHGSNAPGQPGSDYPDLKGVITSPLTGRRPVTYQHQWWTFEHGVPITVEVVVKDQCCGYGSCGPDCLCDDAALCVGTCSNPEHEGRGTE